MKDSNTSKLDNQLCFSLYACSKEIVRRYKPFLDPMDLTYTQYITMLALWENPGINVKVLGECLYLDSGTLTPVLKKLENKGYIVRSRCTADERSVIISLTDRAVGLLEQSGDVPQQINACIDLTDGERAEFKRLLNKILSGLE